MTEESFFENRTLTISALFEKNKCLSDYKILPSSFQRGYCWSQSTALNFIQAIAKGETVNAGTIVLVHNPQKKTLEIVDGQQRLYTLLLFYKAIFRGIGEEHENSFFAKLQQEGGNEEQQLDLPSKIQLSKNFQAIKTKFNSNENDLLSKQERFGALEVSLFFFADIADSVKGTLGTLSYYIDSNTTGVELTPGQLLKAFHYSKIKPCSKSDDEATTDNDIRYLIEAWRLGYLSKFYDSIAPITFNQEKLEEFISTLKSPESSDENKEKRRETINFISSPLSDHLFSVEKFIGNNDWNQAFYEFEGFLNTFQLILYGGRFPKETSLGVPVFHDLQFYPGGILRLQTSCEDNTEEEFDKRTKLIPRLLRIKSGLSFFQTTQDLLFEYSKLVNILKVAFSKDQVNDSPDYWLLETVKAIQIFQADWLTYTNQTDTNKFKHDIKNYGILLSVSCIALLYHLVFDPNSDDKVSVAAESGYKNVGILRDIICSALWGGFSNGAYDTACRGTGIFEAGPIFILSSTPEIARDRMVQAILFNNSNLWTMLSNIKENGRINEFPSLNRFR